MDRCSYFITNKAMFGTFPTQKAVTELENIGVRYFVNLTFDNESKIIPYITEYEYINFPISDRKTPTDWKAFAKFIIKISKIISDLHEGELFYLHCKGGHGRSGVVVACILCYLFKMHPTEALEHTKECHNNRSVMRDKWRKIGSPQTKYQKAFVYKFFEPLNFYRAFKTGPTTGFSNFSLHSVNIPDIGTFPTSEAAFQAYKDLENVDYVKKQINAKTPLQSISIGKKVKLCLNWDEKKDDIMYNILKLKFIQNEDIYKKLLNTGLRPIVEHTRSDIYWGDGGDGHGQNKMGKLLTKLRDNFYEDM